MQERVIERLGGTNEIPIDVRVVCATHRNLEEMIKSGDFREDLYYRLSEIVIEIPALKDREGDAVVLANVFLQRFASEHGRPLKGFTDEALAAIESYPWPGNIREMENKIKRACIMADGNKVSQSDLEISSSNDDEQPLNLKQVREKAERTAIITSIRKCENNMAKAARLLGITRPTLYTMVEKYKIRI